MGIRVTNLGVWGCITYILAGFASGIFRFLPYWFQKVTIAYTFQKASKANQARVMRVHTEGADSGWWWLGIWSGKPEAKTENDL